jgi:hypothetical protein
VTQRGRGWRRRNRRSNSGIAGRRDYARWRRRISTSEAEWRGVSVAEVEGRPRTATHTRARARATATAMQPLGAEVRGGTTGSGYGAACSRDGSSMDGSAATGCHGVQHAVVAAHPPRKPIGTSRDTVFELPRVSSMSKMAFDLGALGLLPLPLARHAGGASHVFASLSPPATSQPGLLLSSSLIQFGKLCRVGIVSCTLIYVSSYALCFKQKIMDINRT